jgi:hypothetical protein
MNRNIKLKTSRDGKEIETDRLRLDVNGVKYTLSIEVDGKLRINKSDYTEKGDDTIYVSPHSGNVIDLS